MHILARPFLAPVLGDGAAVSVRSKDRERDLYDPDGPDEQGDGDYDSADQEIFNCRARWVNVACRRRGWLPRVAGELRVAHGARGGVGWRFVVAVWAIAHGEKLYGRGRDARFLRSRRNPRRWHVWA